MNGQQPHTPAPSAIRPIRDGITVQEHTAAERSLSELS